jgi:glycosyltransferase involved in cell wall biosynthesis
MSLACIVKDCDSRNYAFKMYRVVRQMVQRSVSGVPRAVVDFITVSPLSKRVLESMLPHNRRFHTVMYPIDAVRDTQIHAEANEGVVFVGRLSAEKGGTLLAEAAKRANVAVTFIGDGPERGEIERINPDARVAGWQDANGVKSAMRKARAIVVPSLWYETFGLVVLEAAAMGIPALVPSDTAPNDLVKDGETGLSFERGDVDDLARKLTRLTDEGAVKRMSRTAYESYWSKPQTMDEHIARLIPAYASTLANAEATR